MKKNWLPFLMLGLVVLAFVFAIAIVYWYQSNFNPLVPSLMEADQRADWGAMGDFFGGTLNPLFAFIGIIMLLATLIQSQQELALTRKEIAESTKVLKEQAYTQELQRFEGTFFNLLKLHQEIVVGISIKSVNSNPPQTGRTAFSALLNDLSTTFMNKTYEAVESPSIEYICDPVTGDMNPDLATIPAAEIDSIKGNLQTINLAYAEFYKRHQAEIGHYFRSLYNMLQFIESGRADNKRLYSNLLRAQLSSNEMVILFYNSLSDIGVNTLKPLIEKYSFLKDMPSELLFLSAHKGLYADSAFS